MAAVVYIIIPQTSTQFAPSHQAVTRHLTAGLLFQLLLDGGGQDWDTEGEWEYNVIVGVT